MNPSFWRLKAVLVTVSPILTVCAAAESPLPTLVRFVAGALSAGATALLAYLMKAPESERAQHEPKE